MGEVAERFKATVLKTVVPKGTVSSNLTLSAHANGLIRPFFATYGKSSYIAFDKMPYFGV